jgi:hypothetical protein
METGPIRWRGRRIGAVSQPTPIQSLSHLLGSIGIAMLAEDDTSFTLAGTDHYHLISMKSRKRNEKESKRRKRRKRRHGPKSVVWRMPGDEKRGKKNRENRKSADDEKKNSCSLKGKEKGSWKQYPTTKPPLLPMGIKINSLKPPLMSMGTKINSGES